MDDYVIKVEKRNCMVLSLFEFSRKDTKASKMADYWPILCVFVLFIEIMVIWLLIYHTSY